MTEFSLGIDRWDAVSRSLRHDAISVRNHENIRHDQNAATRTLRHRSENLIDACGVMNRAYDQLGTSVAGGGLNRLSI
jgi:hypothetical protein